MTTRLAAVPVQWGNADKTGNLLPGERAQLRELGDQRERHHGTDPRGRGQQRIRSLKLRVVLRRVLEGLVELCSTSFELRDGLLHVTLHIRVPAAVQAVPLHRQQQGDLMPAVQQRLKRAM
jgi:hypothetical protein